MRSTTFSNGCAPSGSAAQREAVADDLTSIMSPRVRTAREFDYSMIKNLCTSKDPDLKSRYLNLYLSAA